MCILNPVAFFNNIETFFSLYEQPKILFPPYNASNISLQNKKPIILDIGGEEDDLKEFIPTTEEADDIFLEVEIAMQTSLTDLKQTLSNAKKKMG